MTIKGKDTTKKKVGSVSVHRNYPSTPGQAITIQPSRYPTKTVPEYMLGARMKAMLAECERYRKAGSGDNPDTELCMNVIPLMPRDKYPQRLALILETDGPTAIHGKPCPNDALKSSIYCRSCKWAIKRGLQ